MSTPREDLVEWIEDKVYQYAEEIGYDLQDVPEEDQADVLADYAGDRMYSETGEMAEAFRLLDPDKRAQCLKVAASRMSI